MFNRFAKTDEDLLQEQAKFLSNPKPNRHVTTVRCTLPPKNTKVFNVKDSRLANPAVLSTVTERIRAEADNYAIVDMNVCESGLPYVPHLGSCIHDPNLLHAAERIDPGAQKKSLFARQLLASRSLRVDVPEQVSSSSGEHEILPRPLQLLADAGPKTIKGEGLGSLAASQVVRIHEDNLQLLTNLTTEEIMREREEILATADPKILSFLMHKTRSNLANPSTPPRELIEAKKPAITKLKPEDADYSQLPVQPDAAMPHMDVVEPEKLEWMKELPSKAKQAPSILTSGNGEKMKCEDVDKSCQARFDLEGRVVPPTADVDTHLGLHHHGEEPERAGYTISELFHLISSTNPSQRRIALACLASALAATRRGCHADALLPDDAPCLISGLLLPGRTEDSTDGHAAGEGGKAGICFLLRWCLDQAVSEFARSSGASSEGGQGSSLAVVSECLRAFSNLLFDDRGEVVLDETFDWPLEDSRLDTDYAPNLCPSAYPPRKKNVARKYTAQQIGDPMSASARKTGESDTSDHAELMMHDPVGCLFEKTRLAHRLAWLLAPGRHLHTRLAPDAGGVWLANVLLRGVRHSLWLASQIFHTPELVVSLFAHFLPLTTGQPSATVSPRADRLTIGHGVPLPNILKLMRVLAQRSSNIRLALISKWSLVDRCLSYLLPSPTQPIKNCNLNSTESMIGHLPNALPKNICFLLQLESLRCLTVCCIYDAKSSPKAVDTLKARLDDLMIVADFARCEAESHSKEDLSMSLWIGWMAFLSRMFSKFPSDVSQPQMIRLCSWTMNILRKTHDTLRCPQSLPADAKEIKMRLVESNLQPALIAAAVNAATSLKCLNQHRTPAFTMEAIDVELVTTTNQLVDEMFNGDVWRKIVGYFINHESVLTGFPGYSIRDLEPVKVAIPASYIPKKEKKSEGDAEEEQCCLPAWTDANIKLKENLLEPIQVSGTPSLPDLGMTICLRYRTGSELEALTHPAAFWPPTKGPTALAVEQMDIEKPEIPASCRFLPLVAASCRLEGGRECLRQWQKRLVKLQTPPLAEVNPAILPHGLLAIESRLMGLGIIVAKQTLMSSDVEDVYEETVALWKTAIRLLPFIFHGQNDLLTKLFQIIIFPPDEITCVESILQEIYSSGNPRVPWPNVHSNLMSAMAFHSHRVYADFVNYTFSNNGPSCDALLPDDWFYAPLLETYLQGKKMGCASDEETVEVKEKVLSVESEEYLLKATACLGWIRGLLTLFPLSRSAKMSGFLLSPGGHFTRLLCAILASSVAGALCFDLSGVHIGHILRILVPQLTNLQTSSNLPVNVLSLYDLYVELLEQYASLSYGAPIFANCILFFLCQPSLPFTFRSALWSEHQSVLRSFSLSPSEVILPHTCYEGLLTECTDETDEVEKGKHIGAASPLLRAYAGAISSGLIHPTRQPILSLIAVHFINRYIYVERNSGHPFMRQLARSFAWLKSAGSASDDIIDLIRCYKKVVQLPSPCDPTIDQLAAVNRKTSFKKLITVYEPEVPESRAKRWQLFMANSL